MDKYIIDTNRELNQLNNDKKIIEMELSNERDRIANLLMGEMGKDIDDVLCGKKVVKLSFFEKVKYKIKFFLDNLFKTF